MASVIDDLIFQWFKDGQLLQDSENIRLKNEKDFSVIIIDPVGYNSEGNFTCKAITDQSSASHSAVLQIQGKFVNYVLYVFWNVIVFIEYY